MSEWGGIIKSRRESEKKFNPIRFVRHNLDIDVVLMPKLTTLTSNELKNQKSKLEVNFTNIL